MSNQPEIPTPEHEAQTSTPPPPPVRSAKEIADKKLISGLLGIFLGCLGIHKFYLGYQKEGIIMLLVTVVTCGFAGPIPGIIGLIEGILYLTKTDAEFDATYLTGKKPWF